jgi:hypothetical protein
MLRGVLNYIGGKREYKRPGKNPLVIIESDDWGTIRMQSAAVLKKLEAENPEWVNDPYLQYDCLESTEDVEMLAGVLMKHRDYRGNPAVLTANCISMNPDFAAIRENEFSSFVGEPFQTTALKYPGAGKVYEAELAAMKEGVFYPQFHGREHIHTSRWMKGLHHDKDLRNAFDHEIISYYTGGRPPCVGFYMDAMNPFDKEDLTEIISIVKDGLNRFEQTWGFRSQTMMAPCYFWHPDMETALVAEGIKLFQGISVQKVSYLNSTPSSFKKVRRVTGEKNRNGQFYAVRNAYFEPSLDPAISWVGKCLSEMRKAIQQTGVAIICAHRLNFIGSVQPQNRENNLRMLDELLKLALNEWPGLEFGTTVDLLQMMEKDNK